MSFSREVEESLFERGFSRRHLGRMQLEGRLRLSADQQRSTADDRFRLFFIQLQGPGSHSEFRGLLAYWKLVLRDAGVDVVAPA